MNNSDLATSQLEALQKLEGRLVISDAPSHTGKLFYVKHGRACWIREAPMVAKLGLEGQTPISIDLAPDSIGPQIATATFALSEDRQQAVLDRVPITNGQGLEMSPGARPIISKNIADVTYCDKVDVSAWKDTYKEELDVYDVVVLGEKLIDDVFDERSFDYIVSSHVIEHIPDFIQFFKSAQNLLRPNGKIVMLAPDKRFTFDILREPSTIAQIEDAHHRKLRHPCIEMVEDFYLNVDNDATADNLWNKTHHPKPLYSEEDARSMIAETDLTKIDLHCYTFTPGSFRTLINHVISQYTPELRLEDVSETPFGSIEFLVELSRV